MPQGFAAFHGRGGPGAGTCSGGSGRRCRHRGGVLDSGRRLCARGQAALQETYNPDRLRNAGYAQARDALRTLDEAGFRPPMVWIDVEHLRKQPWPIGSTAKHKANRHVLTGLMWGFADARMPFGFYSYANGWKEITGGWRLPEVPVWATAGRRDRDAAVAMCERPSFSGGPVLIAQWYNDVRDDDISCIPFTLRPPVPPAPGPPPLPATVASWPPG